MKGRKPKPTGLRLIENNREGRTLNKSEAVVPPSLPIPPAHLSSEALEEWARVGTELYNCGLLGGVDRAVLAAYCQCYGRWVQAENAIKKMAARDELTSGLMIKTTNGNAIQNPLVGTANKAAADMAKYAAEFGMTPSARSRISANPPEKESALKKYFA